MIMNKYLQNLNRIEFVMTLACTGKCKHCSEGEHKSPSEHINGDDGAEIVYKICENFSINSLMTFGGEPLLYADDVCKIHAAAKDMEIPNREIITNGFFSKNEKKINETALQLAESGVTEIALSVDAFHQETIPLDIVKYFAKAVKATGVVIHTHPAWLVNKEADNPYNKQTHEILKEFEEMGITASDGNNIFPSGNALKYLKEYFATDKEYISPYLENPEDIRAISISQNGNVLNGNIYQNDILDIIRNYKPNI